MNVSVNGATVVGPDFDRSIMERENTGTDSGRFGRLDLTSSDPRPRAGDCIGLVDDRRFLLTLFCLTLQSFATAGLDAPDAFGALRPDLWRKAAQ